MTPLTDVEGRDMASRTDSAVAAASSRSTSETQRKSEDEPLTLKPARVIVCGGRDFHDYYRLANVMDRLRAIRPIALVFHGNARGADALADRWCRERGVPVFPVPAEWSKHGKAAGPKRNQAMLGHGIDLVVAFPGGKGTEDMMRRARKAGVLVTRAVANPGLRPEPTAAAEGRHRRRPNGKVPGMNPSHLLLISMRADLGSLLGKRRTCSPST
jgi:hypothetical protein